MPVLCIVDVWMDRCGNKWVWPPCCVGVQDFFQEGAGRGKLVNFLPPPLGI